jgi:hypothetical protein
VKRYLFSKASKLVYPWPPKFYDDWFTDKPLVLFADIHPEWNVTTKFMGVDAREEYPGSRLSKIKVDLPFVTEFVNRDIGNYSAYWHNYWQAELGHRLMLERAENISVDYRIVTRSLLSKKLDRFDIPSIDEVTLSKSEQLKYSTPAVYKPINIAPSGYERDIERFIHL